jgi:hypothetical protein
VGTSYTPQDAHDFTASTRTYTLTGLENTQIQYSVSATSAGLESVAVTTLLAKTAYKTGEQVIDTTGIVITGTDTVNVEAILNPGDFSYTFDSSLPVTVRRKGTPIPASLSASFDVRILNNTAALGRRL